MKKYMMTFLSISARAIIWIAVIALIYQSGVKAYDFGFRIFAEKPMSSGAGKEYPVIINKSDSDYDIGKMLKKKGLIRDSKLFAVQCKLSPYGDKIKPGHYTLNTAMTPKEMIQVLAGDESKDDSEKTEG